MMVALGHEGIFYCAEPKTVLYQPFLPLSCFSVLPNPLALDPASASQSHWVVGSTGKNGSVFGAVTVLWAPKSRSL